ncbi:SPR.2 family protein [Megaselia abdita]
MALCDMLTALFPAPGLFYMFTLGNHYKPLAPVQYCIIYSLFNEAVPAMFHTASIWLTLALAVQRYIFVCHAPMARTWCTMQRVKRCTFFILLAAFLHQVPRIFDTNTIGEKILWSNTTVEVCRMETASWVIDFGVDTYYISFFMFRIFFVHLIPCALLVTLNVLLFRAMKKAQDRRKKLLHDRNKDCSKTRDANCTTLMLIVVVTVFLIVEIPIAVITSLHVISSTIYVILDYNIANLFITFMNFFLVLSYPINFAIYCGMSRQFRVNFKEIFVKNSGPPGKKYSLVNGPRTCTNETVL